MCAAIPAMEAPLITARADPQWFNNNEDSATFRYRVSGKMRAFVEVTVYARNKNKGDDPVGNVTFQLGTVQFVL